MIGVTSLCEINGSTAGSSSLPPARRKCLLRTRPRCANIRAVAPPNPIPGTDRLEVGGCTVDVARVGDGRVKRSVYPAGFRWSKDMQQLVGGERCMHAHVGFLVEGKVEGAYADGCTFAFEAPAPVVIEPGHDAWVPGDEEAVLIEFDFEGETAERFGLPSEHSH
jgi:hypothetical protein